MFEREKYLWGNSAYALGQCIARAFARYHWCAAIRGLEGGGLIADLPLHTLETDQGDVAVKCPTEIAITDRREMELADLGFIPLAYCKGSDFAVFFSTQTTHKPKVYDTNSATADARLTSRLEYVLTLNRFAHYFKCILRDKIGSFMTRKNAEDYLNRWIHNYVQGDTAGQELRVKFPLKEARVDVEEIRGKPGAYRAVAHLMPYYQLDETNNCMRMVMELPAPAQ